MIKFCVNIKNQKGVIRVLRIWHADVLAEKIRVMFQRSYMRRRFIEAGFQQSRRFTWDQIADLHHRVYRLLLL